MFYCIQSINIINTLNYTVTVLFHHCLPHANMTLQVLFWIKVMKVNRAVLL